MKKFLWYTLAMLVAAAAFSSCKEKEPEPEVPTNVVATVNASELLDAAAAAYAVWEDDTTIPASLTVGSKSLTLPQYQYAICKLLTNLASGDKSAIDVINYKAADHPERDSYDKKEIEVKNGPKINEGTEDLVDIAKRMLAAMEDKLTVPNQTVITRTGESAIAFSTNRATVTILRALAAYKSSGSLPKSVETEYLSAAASLKGFAEQFVGILDIWKNTVGTVSADGSHCTDNNSAWKDVHFVPIPHSGGAYADGVDQYDAKYQPYFTVTIDGKEYTSAQTWGIALRGIVDMITKEGSEKAQVNRNPFEHTMGNGASLKEPIPAVKDVDIWGQYPWYESTNDGRPINQSEFTPYLIARCATWFLTRQEALGKIGNYQFFCTDPDQGFVEEGVDGFVSSMRMWLIAARFYKYLLDNGITENVYDAVKDVKFDTDLYGVEMPDIELSTKKVDLESNGKAVSAKFFAKKAWTAEASESWIHVDPTSGDPAEEVVVAISADPNTGDEREGTVVIKGGNVKDGLAITVTQAKYVEPAKATLKEFATEFVKGLDVWEATVGTVESEGYHLISKGTAWTDVHYIPVGHTGGGYDDHGGNQYDETLHPAWTLNVNGETYTSAQAYEVAIKGLLNMVIAEGEEFLPTMDDRNKAYTLADNKSLSEQNMATPTEKAKWGGYPWYEQDDYYTTVTYNGQPIESVDINFVVKACAWHLVRGTVATANNSPLGNIGNFQVFDTDPGTLTLDGYLGYISPMRELLILMRIYKYILDNNIDKNVYSAIKDQKFDFDLYGVGIPETPKPTIADFAKEFAKVADKWDANVGTVSYSREGTTYKHENVHFVPEGFVITLNGINYDKFQMHEMGMRALKALEGGAAMTEPVEEPGSYEPATSPYHEYDDPLQEKVAKLDLISNFATRCLNYLKNNGEWPNVCGYPRTTDPVLTNYNGYVCVERDLLMLSRLFRYMVKNDVTSLDAVKDVEIDTELWGEYTPGSATIGDFAKEYVKILDIWEKTTGTINYLTGETPGSNYETDVRDAHYVPSSTTISVGGKTYTTGDMLELAERSYLLLRGFDGNQTSGGLNAFATVDKATFSTALPETHGTTFGPASFNEYGTTYAGRAYNANCGPLRMGSPDTADGKASSVKFDILDNFAQRHVNWPMTHDGVHSNMCGYCERLDGYYGCFSAQRALVTYAFFFKYMLDNNLTDVTSIPESTVFRSENLGSEHDDYGAGPNSIKAFADAYVKALNIWYRTTGTINFLTGETLSGSDYVEEFDNPDAHYIPTATTLTINGDNSAKKTFTTGDLLEIGERAYLLLRGYDGNQTTGGKGAFAEVSKAKLTDAMPESHGTSFGPASFNESGTTSAGNVTTGNGGHLRMGNPNTADGKACSVKFDILDNFAQRHVNWPMTHDGVHSNMCGYASGQLEGYYGCFSAQRALVTYGLFFEYLVKNGLNSVESIAADTVFRSEEFGDEK